MLDATRRPAEAAGTGSDPASARRTELLVILALCFVVLACYWPVREHGFVNYDDPLYVTANGRVQQGISQEGVRFAFRDMKSSSNWHPLTWLSHMLDWQLFGANAAGHHWTSVSFHIANTILLYGLLRLLTHAVWPGAFVAALFAVHPLNVESVAWVAERKNVLSTFFGLLTILCYALYVRKPEGKRYAALLVSYALGLLAKPMLVTLPFLLLLLDHWPLGRFGAAAAGGDPTAAAGKSGSDRSGTGSAGRLLAEKIPLFVLAAASALITLVAADAGGALATMEQFPLPARLANALQAYANYIQKGLWPQDLAVFYPYRWGRVSPQLVWPLLLLVSLTLLSTLQARSRPYLLVGWCWFLGTLVPVIGLVQVSSQAMADRYAYVPLVGLFLMVAWTAADWVGDHRKRGMALIPVALLTILALGSVTREQVLVWRNSRTLFAHALEATGSNPIAHHNLAQVLFEEGDAGGAIFHYRQALRINPRFANAHGNLGLALAANGQLEEAIGHYRIALQIEPGMVNTKFNIAVALDAQGNEREAGRFYEAVLQDDPEHYFAHRISGLRAMKRGEYGKAVLFFKAALYVRPGDASLRRAIAIASALRDGRGFPLEPGAESR